MPVKDWSAYPDVWPAISEAIRFDRAGGRCECTGECGWPPHLDAINGSLLQEPQEPRCAARHREASPYTGSKVVLTVAHLTHDPAIDDPTLLKAMCQGCHLSYDRDLHAANRAATLAARRQA